METKVEFEDVQKLLQSKIEHRPQETEKISLKSQQDDLLEVHRRIEQMNHKNKSEI